MLRNKFRKKRIALLTPTFSPFSGIDRVVKQDVDRYMSKGYNVTIFTFRAEMDTKAKLVELGMPKKPAYERIYRLLFFLDRKKIKITLEQLKSYDKIIVYFYPFTWLGYLAKKKYNIEYTYWNAGVAYPKLFNKISEKIYIFLFNWLVNKSINNADNVISISKFLSNELKNETGIKSKVEYIEFDRKKFNKKVSGLRIRRKYNLRNNPVLLYVGRISPHKGIDLLLQAFNLVLKKIPNAKLLIVGKHTFDEYSKRLKKFSNPSVIFTGFIEDKDLPKYYAACDVYTTATLWEGFDMPIVEANYTGKPVVAFNLCSHPEVLKKGILVKPKDIKEFGDAVIKILKKKN